MRRWCSICASAAALLAFALGAPESASSADALPAVSLQLLVGRIPSVAPPAVLAGSQFVEYVAGFDSRRREQAIFNQLSQGNLPAFLRHLSPVKLGRMTIFVMPDYLSIGSDQDYLRIPVDLYTASAIAIRSGFILPTRKMVNAIYQQAAVHLAPEPMTPGPQMTSTAWYQTHNTKIEAQARTLRITPGTLISGHKKDLVITNRLSTTSGHVAIYGWHRLSGAPIQPLSTVHGGCYADYSHGLRLVSDTVLVDGQARSVYDVLKDPALAGVLSDEGPIPNLRETLTRTAAETPCKPSTSGL